jgi:hypothetical protein
MLLLGSYQIKSAKAYIIEHLKPSYIDPQRSEFIVELCEQHPDLVRAHFDSRHSSSRTYRTTIRYHDQIPHIREWYCTCVIGSRVIGCCAHVAALLWYLGVERGIPPTTVHPLSTIRLLNAIDNSTRLEEFDLEVDEEGHYVREVSTNDSDTEEQEEDNDHSD